MSNPGTTLSFGGNSLQTSNIIISQIDGLDDWPTLDAKVYALAHSNGSVIPYENWPNKVITITGEIYGSSITNLDSNMDSFKGFLLGTLQNLDIGYNSTTRRYIATVTKTAIKRPQNLMYAQFTVEFTCTQPWGQNTTTTSLTSASGATGGTRADSITVGGNAPYQLPIITVTYSAIGSAPVAGTVSVGNNGTGQQINVVRTWAATDVLVIDATQNTVTVNGLPVDFSGAFPSFAPGTQTLGYADTFASRTFNYSAVYFPYFL